MTEDAVDLSLTEAVVAVSRRRRYVIAGLLIGLLTGVGLALLLRPVYEGTVVLAIESQRGSQLGELARNLGGLAAVAGISLGSEGGERETSIAKLDSYAATESFIESQHIARRIFAESRGPFASMPWADTSDSSWEAVRILRKHMSVEVANPSGLITVRVLWYDPRSAATWANAFARHTDSLLRQDALDRSERRIQFLTRELDGTREVAIRDAMAKVMENELRTLTLASADDEYVFRVIDAAVAADRPVRPRRALLVVMLTSLGGFAGIVAALLAAMLAKRRA